MVAPDDPTTPRDDPSEPMAPVFVLGGPIDRADIPVLCERFHAAVEASGDASRSGDPGHGGGHGGRQPVVCDVGALAGPAAVTVEAVDALARLALTARRLGRRLVLQGAGDDLRALLVLTGLAEVVLPDECSGDDDPLVA